MNYKINTLIQKSICILKGYCRVICKVIYPLHLDFARHFEALNW